MREALNKLALVASASINDAEVFLRGIPNDDPNSFVDFVVSRIRTGEYRARDIFSDDVKVGITVYYTEDFDAHREFVSVATYTNKPLPCFSEFWQIEIEKLALSLACKSIRFATVRHGLIKNALSAGWHVAEITLRKHISHV